MTKLILGVIGKETVNERLSQREIYTRNQHKFFSSIFETEN